MSQILEIEGLSELTQGERNTPMAGTQFALPVSFDSRRFASKWALEGPSVDEAQQDTILAFAGKKARGWSVYKEIPKQNPNSPKVQNNTPMPVVRVAGKNKFVLMFRPKLLQTALNHLYAIKSRELVNQEILGEKVSANIEADPGILSNEDLRKAQRQEGPDDPTPLPRGSAQADDPERVNTLNLA